MARKRKLQVFVSSTYLDLKEERQAAVEAILAAGHIPAGMELFAAGDQSQMTVIRRWIDESDVYVLLLGGRYGSIDPNTGKSYTHLEYEYAIEKGKALFALVITEEYLEVRNRKRGSKVLERENPQKMDEFKELVTSRLVKFWGDNKDIQLSIMQTLSEFDRREDLVGWIPGSEASDPIVAEELAKLHRENAELRVQLNLSSIDNTKYNGLTFNQMYSVLNQDTIEVSQDAYRPYYFDCLREIACEFGDEKISLVHFFWLWDKFTKVQSYEAIGGFGSFLMSKLEYNGIVSKDPSVLYADRYLKTQAGKDFMIRLTLERPTKTAEQYLKTLFDAEDSFRSVNHFQPFVTP